MGKDEIALTMLDGWLIGDGVRAELALRAEDIYRISGRSGQSRVLTLTDGSEVALSGFADLDGRTTQARWAIEAWQRDGARPTGEPTFPPGRAHPQEEARWLTWMVSGIVLMAVLPVELFLRKGAVADIVACVLFVAGAVVGVVGSARRHDLSVESFKAMRESSEHEAQKAEAANLAGLTDLLGQTPPGSENSNPLTAKRL